MKIFFRCFSNSFSSVSEIRGNLAQQISWISISHTSKHFNSACWFVCVCEMTENCTVIYWILIVCCCIYHLDKSVHRHTHTSIKLNDVCNAKLIYVYECYVCYFLFRFLLCCCLLLLLLTFYHFVFVCFNINSPRVEVWWPRFYWQLCGCLYYTYMLLYFFLLVLTCAIHKYRDWDCLAWLLPLLLCVYIFLFFLFFCSSFGRCMCKNCAKQ